jgi:O-succinylbenzoic acid--CoA ligase
MEATALITGTFWESDAPILAGGHPAPADVPGLVYFRTSGTTGTPKWIGLSRRALLASAEMVNRHLRVDARSGWALALPLDHVGGFGVAARAWQAGCRFARWQGKWQPAAFTAWLATTGTTHLSLVPTQVHDLVTHRLHAPAGLAAVVVGGGLLDETAGHAARALGWPVLASYGMTETASQVATQGLDLLDFPYSPLPLPLLPDWQARIVADGIIALRGAALFSGTLVPSGDGWNYEERRGEWHATSDTGRLDGRELHLTGRADTRVKILGELVDPTAVETALLAHLPAGRFAVAAVPDPRAGHRLVLVHEHGIDPAPALAAYHATCPGFLRIAAATAVPTLPRSALGKPIRAELSRIAAVDAI